MLEVIDSVQQVPEDLGAFPNWNIHKLSGELKEFWSIKVNKIIASYFVSMGSMPMMWTILIIIKFNYEQTNEKHSPR